MEGPASSATTIVDDDEMARVHDIFASRQPYRIEYHFEDGVVVSDRVFGVVFVPLEKDVNDEKNSGVIGGTEGGEIHRD